MSVTVGIDLGDHSVKVAVWSNDQIVPVTFDGELTFPTCIGFSDSGTVLTLAVPEMPLLGPSALAQASRNFSSTIYGYKAALGCPFSNHAQTSSQTSSSPSSHIQVQQSKSQELEFVVTHQGLITAVNSEEVLEQIMSHVKNVLQKQFPGELSCVLGSTYNMVRFLAKI